MAPEVRRVYGWDDGHVYYTFEGSPEEHRLEPDSELYDRVCATIREYHEEAADG